MKSTQAHAFLSHKLRRSYKPLSALIIAVAISLTHSPLQAGGPDLTSGGTRTDDKFWNLGPTGMAGWFYHEGSSTDPARQIEVVTVDAGSPADGILAAGDVILGADGTGAAPVNFSLDARKSLAYAIADAEARSPATLKLLRWRAGTTSTVSITLETLGAYSATAPYNCPKSAAILEKGLDAVMAGGGSDNYNLSLLALLAGNDPNDPDNAARMTRAQQEAHELILTQAQIDEYTSGDVLTYSKIAWTVGFKMVAIAEYYLATNDPAVYDSLRAYAIAYANGQSMFGTGGHQFAQVGADGSINGPYGVGYGVVNSANMQCFYGLVLARKAGVNEPVVDEAIVRSSRFYRAYVDRGSIPYGEHQPGGGFESNGKMGISALIFKHMGTEDYAANYYARMAGASAKNRDGGHTGPYMNYLWAPLGANAAGEESMAAFFAEQSWHYDLSRNWDGSFTYNTYGQGNNGGPSWSGNFQMYLTALLTYATPLRQTYTTGKGLDPAKALTTTEVDAVKLAITYDATTRTKTELLADLGHPVTPVRWMAATEIGNRTANDSVLLEDLLPTLHTMATDPAEPVPSRMGACFALGKIADDRSVPVLAGLLTDAENLVIWAASKVLPNFADAPQLAVIDTLLSACISTAKPLLPLDEDDPIHLAHANICYLIFGNGAAGSPRGVLYGHDLVGIDRDLLYPAIRAAAATPLGLARSAMSNIYGNLSREGVDALGDALVKGAREEAPADRMFSMGVRVDSLKTMAAHNISEGVPLAKHVFKDRKGSGDILPKLETYAGSSLKVKPDPQIVAFCKSVIANGSSFSAEAQAVLDAIAADAVPDEPTPFKRIHWIFPDKASLTLPENSTVLRVDAHDYARGDSVYTWRKVHGAGEVTFIPNGTAEAKDATVVFDGTPGQYLFEVTMSDSLGLTEVTKTVVMTLYDTDGTLPANSAPTADAQTITATQGTPTPIVLAGSDPDGDELVYSLVTEPQHGVLSGTTPNLVYTANFDYTGSDSFTFKVIDSEGQESSVTINITVDPSGSVGLAVYEPFDYPFGTFKSYGGTSEIGLDGTWTTHSSMNLVADSLGYGALTTIGGSVGDLDGGSTFGGARTISTTALAGNGLLADGATLWFSAAVGTGPSTYQRQFFLALANDKFADNNFYINDDGTQLGSGVGFTMDNGTLVATQFGDASLGSGISSHVRGTWDDEQGRALENEVRLVVGKISWGATSDTIEIYLPFEDLRLPSKPSSVLSVDVDQSTYDTLTFARFRDVVWDELRFGATYQSVVQGTVAMTADVTAPTPDPMTFAIAPTPASSSSITMTATPAFDPLGVEYYFTCTAGGGSDSGWQDSNVYTPTGLTPGTTYSYTIKARDMVPGLNETAASAAVSATIPSQGTVPDTVGMLQASAESLIIDAGLAVGTVTTSTQYSLTVPAGHVLSQTPTANTAANYGSTVDLVISKGQDPALPTLAPVDIVDNQSGGPVVVNSLITYTLTFSEDMDAATVDATDFTNAGDAAISIGTITETSAGVFTVEVTPTSAGVLRFAVAEGATINDAQTEALNTTSAIIDDTTIVVNLPDVIVPDVVGLAQATAESNLATANLTVGTIHEIYDETVAAGKVISQNPLAGASIPGQSPVDLVVSLGPPPDTTAPVVASLAPFNGEGNVEVNDDLTVYFDEDVVAGTGNIVIRNLNDATETLIDVTDTTQVRISGVVMTIDPSADLQAGKVYAVLIDGGAVSDIAGNAFAGINDNTIWNFATTLTSQETVLFAENFENPDVTAYTEGTSPINWVRSDQGSGSLAHGLTDKVGGDFDAADPNHQAYAFRAGNTGITTAEGAIATLAEGVTYEVTFDVIRDDGLNAGTDYEAQFIAFNPGDARNDHRTYTPGTLLASQSGNATDNGSFSTVTLQYTVPAGDASIGMDLALRFLGGSTSAIIDNVVVKTVNPNAADEVAPVVTRFLPVDDSSTFRAIDNLVLEFNEDILAGSGLFTIMNLTNNTETTVDVTDPNQFIVSGSTVYINPTADLLPDCFYAVRIPAGAIYDLSGNSFVGIDNDTRWSFSIGDISEAVAPTIVSLNPLDGATGVAYGSNFTASFDENVVASTGSITLKNLTDASQMTIDIRDESQVTISGPDVIIDPVGYLAGGKDYAVQIDAGAILDLSGNPHAGIADNTTWNFSSAAPDMTAPNPDPMTWAVLPTPGIQSSGTTQMMLSTAPTIDEADIAHSSSVAGTQRIWTSDPAVGQTFTTGAEETLLKSLTCLLNDAVAEKTYVVRVGTVSGTTFTEIHSETFTQSFDADTTEHVTWQFGTPLRLAANTQYGIDIGLVNNTVGWQLGMPKVSYTSDLYAAGSLYQSGTYGIGTASINLDASRDLIFHLDLSVAVGTAADSIVMTATTASDDSGVEYYFTETSGNPGGSNSGWQDSSQYIDTGLQSGVQYTYTVMARDKSTGQNTTVASASASATTGRVPVADDQSVVTVQDTAMGVTLTASDLDGDALTYAVVTAPTNGTLSGTAPNLTYTPNASYRGSDSFTFKANDGLLDSNTATVSITVNAPADAPVAYDQSLVTDEGTAVAVTLTGSDPNGDPLTYTVVDAPTNGTLSGTAPNLTYTPNAYYDGSDSFTFVTNDGTYDSDPATVSITMIAVGVIVFTESFESPDVAGNGDGSNPAGWDVFGNGNYIGVVDENGGDFSTPDGNQGMSCYTSWGATNWSYAETSSTILSETLKSGITYTFEFNVAAVAGRPAAYYRAELVAVDDTTGTKTVLGSLASANDGSTDMSYRDSLVFTPDSSHDSLLGQRLTLRLGMDYDYGTAGGSYQDKPIFDQVVLKTSGGDDTTAPTVVDIVDDAAGGPVAIGTLVTYTLTFSEDIDATTMDAADFGNAGTAPVTLGTITEISPGVFTVDATPTAAGSLQLQVNAGAVITDVAGNALDTSTAILDDTTITVEVAANASPVWTTDPVLEANATEDAAYTSTLSDDASDADGDALSFAKVSGPTWLSVTSNGDLSGTPLNADVGTNNFIVSVSDGVNPAVEATLTIEVINTNDAPVWASDPVLEANATEGASYSSTLSGDASDPDGDALTYAKVSGPIWLSVATDGALSGTPLNADVGTNSFTVSVTDGMATTEATLTIEVRADTNPPTLTWLSPNSGAVNVATDALLIATFDEPITLKDGGSITITDLTDGTSTTGITLPDARVTSPNGDDLSINLGTPLDVSGEYEVIIGGAAVEDLASTPNAYAGTSVGEWTFTTRANGIFVANDTGGTITVDSGTDQANRTTTFPDWSLNGGNTVVVFFSAEGQDLSSATYGGQAMNIVQDTSGGRWDAAIAYLINPSVTTGDIVLTWADAVNGSSSNEIGYTPFALGAVGGVITSGANDTGGLNFAYTTTLDGGYVLGSATNNNYDGSAPPTFSGDNFDTIEYQSNISGNFSTLHVHGAVATAGSYNETLGSAESSAAVVLKTSGGDDTTAPTVVDIVDDAAGGPVAENTLVTYTVSFSEDIDETTVDAADFGNAGTSPVTIGTITETSAGVFTVEVTPTADGSLQLQINAGAVITDVAGNALDTTTAIADDTVITVEAVNNAPVADAQSVATNEDTAVAVTLTASDADGDALTYTVVTAPTNGTLSGTAPSLTYTPNGDYNGLDSFTFKANDGTVDSNTATVSITVNAINDAPVFTSDPFAAADATEDAAYSATITGSATDAEGEPLTYAKVSGPTWLSVGLDGALSGTPLNADVGSNSFTVSASDGTATTQATLNITVINVNDAPVAVAQSVATDEDTALAVTLTASDVDGDALTYTVVTAPTNGTLSGIAPSLTYTPNANYNGSDSFTFVANDGLLGSNTATVSITVNAINDAPVFVSDPFSTSDATEAQPYSDTIAGSATDADGDTLTYAKVNGPAWLAVASDGTLSGTPTSADIGANSFTVSVSDGFAAAVTATLNIQVNGGAVADYAYAEIFIAGTVSGGITDTYDSNNIYEAITEEESKGKPSERSSFLEHNWEFDVIGGDSVSFHLEAYHSANTEGDDFTFAYSTTGVDGVYTDMLTVTKTSDDDTEQSFTLPAGTIGVIHVRVLDADISAGNNALDTLNVDHMYFLSQ